MARNPYAGERLSGKCSWLWKPRLGELRVIYGGEEGREGDVHMACRAAGEHLRGPMLAGLPGELTLVTEIHVLTPVPTIY